MKRFIVFLAILIAQSGLISGGPFSNKNSLTIVPHACLWKQGIPATCSVTATGGVGGYVFSKANGSGNFPGGIGDINLQGSYSGTPSGTASGTETVQVVDSAGNSTTLPITIVPASLSSITVLPMGQSIAINQTQQLSGPSVWSDGSMCPSSTCGANLASLGTWNCSGTGFASISATGLFTASGSAGTPSCTLSFGTVTSPADTITVLSTAPTISTNATLCAGQINQPYPEVGSTGTGACAASLGVAQGIQFAASGGTPPYTWSVNAGSPSTGTSLSAAGVLSGTPTGSAGTASWTVKVTDNASNTATLAVSQPIASISTVAVTLAQSTVAQGATDQITATANYSDSSTHDLSTATAGGSAFWTHVQGNKGDNTAAGTTASASLTGVTAGNVLSCKTVNSSNVNITLSSLQDDLLNNFSLTAHSPTTFLANVGQVAIGNILSATGGNRTCKATWGTSEPANTFQAFLDEWSFNGGSVAVSPDSVNASGGPGTNINSPSVTSAGSVDLLECLADPRFSITSGNSPWVLGGSGIIDGIATEYILNASGAQACNFTVNSSGTWSALGNDITLTPTASSNGLTWSETDVSGKSVCSIAGSGLAFCPNSGKATFTMTVDSAHSGTGSPVTGTSPTLTVTAVVTDTGLLISPSPASCTVGSAITFKALGNNTGNDLTAASLWASNNTAVASQTSGPTFRCNAASGTTPPTITATDGSLTGSTTLTSTAVGSSSLLTGCTVSAVNVPSCSTPAGWTLVGGQGFETGALSAGQSLFGGTSIACGFAHTGSCALKRFNNSGDQPTGMIVSGASLNSRETYASWWEYLDPQARLNLQMIETRRSIFDSGGNTLTDILWNWEDGAGGCYQNCTSAQSSFYAEGRNGLPNFSKYDGSYALFLGIWVQYEVDLKTNDPGLSNGSITIYRNGTLIQTVGNLNFNGNQDMALAQLEIGGYNEALVYWNDAAHTQCTAPQTLGPFTTNNASWGACQCSAQCPPNGTIPTFNRYIDDVIVLKK